MVYCSKIVISSSLVYRINDTIRIVDTLIRYTISRYVSYHLVITNIAETVIKLKSHTFHANIEAGIPLGI